VKCLSPIDLSQNDDYSYLVPCGQCEVCQEFKIKEWSLRMYHEMDEHERYSFLTLTYDDEHLPSDESLDIREMQLFWKRLRKNTGKKIKYYCCGEYGTENRRPHYHAIVFGLGLSEDDKKEVNDAWQKGFVGFGSVTPQSIRYCLNYTRKQVNEDLKNEFYKTKSPPFQKMSKGLGSSFVEKNRDYIMQDLCITKNGFRYSIPRYYMKKLNLTIEQLVEFEAKRQIKLSSKDFKIEAYEEFCRKELLRIQQRKLMLSAKKNLKKRK